VELRQLRHFLALVEERSFTGAARRELIVQSGLSNSIQALERELGTPLYVSGTRPIWLTAAGEALAGPARRTRASAAQAEQAVHQTRDGLIGTLRLGVCRRSTRPGDSAAVGALMPQSSDRQMDCI
jgi:DNA-binding transcriptional LysR family regulator